MKKIPRNPLRFETFSMFSQHAQQIGASIRSCSINADFIERMRASLKSSLTDDAFLFGLRTEMMFAYMVPILGNAVFLKKEDTDFVLGNNSEDSIQVPDYRLVLKDGKQLLVEVKNLFQTPSNCTVKKFKLHKSYCDGLLKYGQLMSIEVKIAIYWSIWRTWTLVPLEAFESIGNYKVISFMQAMYRNEMSILGDAYLGCPLPLRLECIPQEKKLIVADTRDYSFHLRQYNAYCREKLITDSKRRQIAMNLMLYGKLETDGPLANVSEGILKSVEHIFYRMDDAGKKKPWSLVSTVSSMFSRFYTWQTSGTEGKSLIGLHVDIAQEDLQPLIPEGFDTSSEELPLVIMHVQPSSEAPKEFG